MGIDTVIAKLDEMNEAHAALLALGRRKREVVVSNDVDELSAIVHKETKLVKQIGEIESAWRTELVKFIESRGFRATQATTFGDAVKLVVQSDQKEALIDAQDRLLATIDELREINELNQKLIEQSLSYIEYSLDLMTGDAGQDVVYRRPEPAGGSGSSAGKRRRGVFDIKA